MTEATAICQLAADVLKRHDATAICQLAADVLKKHDDHPQYFKIGLPGIQGVEAVLNILQDCYGFSHAGGLFLAAVDVCLEKEAVVQAVRQQLQQCAGGATKSDAPSQQDVEPQARPTPLQQQQGQQQELLSAQSSKATNLGTTGSSESTAGSIHDPLEVSLGGWALPAQLPAAARPGARGAGPFERMLHSRYNALQQAQAGTIAPAATGPVAAGAAAEASHAGGANSPASVGSQELQQTESDWHEAEAESPAASTAAAAAAAATANILVAFGVAAGLAGAADVEAALEEQAAVQSASTAASTIASSDAGAAAEPADDASSCRGSNSPKPVDAAADCTWHVSSIRAAGSPCEVAAEADQFLQHATPSQENSDSACSSQASAAAAGTVTAAFLVHQSPVAGLAASPLAASGLTTQQQQQQQEQREAVMQQQQRQLQALLFDAVSDAVSASQAESLVLSTLNPILASPQQQLEAQRDLVKELSKSSMIGVCQQQQQEQEQLEQQLLLPVPQKAQELQQLQQTLQFARQPLPSVQQQSSPTASWQQWQHQGPRQHGEMGDGETSLRQKQHPSAGLPGSPFACPQQQHMQPALSPPLVPPLLPHQQGSPVPYKQLPEGQPQALLQQKQQQDLHQLAGLLETYAYDEAAASEVLSQWLSGSDDDIAGVMASEDVVSDAAGGSYFVSGPFRTPAPVMAAQAAAVHPHLLDTPAGAGASAGRHWRPAVPAVTAADSARAGDSWMVEHISSAAPASAGPATNRQGVWQTPQQPAAVDAASEAVAAAAAPEGYGSSRSSTAAACFTASSAASWGPSPAAAAAPSQIMIQPQPHADGADMQRLRLDIDLAQVLKSPCKLRLEIQRDEFGMLEAAAASVPAVSESPHHVESHHPATWQKQDLDDERPESPSQLLLHSSNSYAGVVLGDADLVRPAEHKQCNGINRQQQQQQQLRQGPGQHHHMDGAIQQDHEQDMLHHTPRRRLQDAAWIVVDLQPTIQLHAASPARSDCRDAAQQLHNLFEAASNPEDADPAVDAEASGAEQADPEGGDAASPAAAEASDWAAVGGQAHGQQQQLGTALDPQSSLQQPVTPAVQVRSSLLSTREPLQDTSAATLSHGSTARVPAAQAAATAAVGARSITTERDPTTAAEGDYECGCSPEPPSLIATETPAGFRFWAASKAAAGSGPRYELGQQTLESVSVLDPPMSPAGDGQADQNAGRQGTQPAATAVVGLQSQGPAAASPAVVRAVAASLMQLAQQGHPALPVQSLELLGLDDASLAQLGLQHISLELLAAHQQQSLELQTQKEQPAWANAVMHHQQQPLQLQPEQGYHSLELLPRQLLQSLHAVVLQEASEPVGASAEAPAAVSNMSSGQQQQDQEQQRTKWLAARFGATAAQTSTSVSMQLQELEQQQLGVGWNALSRHGPRELDNSGVSSASLDSQEPPAAAAGGAVEAVEAGTCADRTAEAEPVCPGRLTTKQAQLRLQQIREEEQQLLQQLEQAGPQQQSDLPQRPSQQSNSSQGYPEACTPIGASASAAASRAAAADDAYGDEMCATASPALVWCTALHKDGQNHPGVQQQHQAELLPHPQPQSQPMPMHQQHPPVEPAGFGTWVQALLEGSGASQGGGSCTASEEATQQQQQRLQLLTPATDPAQGHWSCGASSANAAGPDLVIESEFSSAELLYASAAYAADIGDPQLNRTSVMTNPLYCDEALRASKITGEHEEDEAAAAVVPVAAVAAEGQHGGSSNKERLPLTHVSTDEASLEKASATFRHASVKHDSPTACSPEASPTQHNLLCAFRSRIRQLRASVKAQRCGTVSSAPAAVLAAVTASAPVSPVPSISNSHGSPLSQALRQYLPYASSDSDCNSPGSIHSNKSKARWLGQPGAILQQHSCPEQQQQGPEVSLMQCQQSANASPAGAAAEHASEAAVQVQLPSNLQSMEWQLQAAAPGQQQLQEKTVQEIGLVKGREGQPQLRCGVEQQLGAGHLIQQHKQRQPQQSDEPLTLLLVHQQHQQCQQHWQGVGADVNHVQQRELKQQQHHHPSSDADLELADVQHLQDEQRNAPVQELQQQQQVAVVQGKDGLHQQLLLWREHEQLRVPIPMQHQSQHQSDQQCAQQHETGLHGSFKQADWQPSSPASAVEGAAAAEQQPSQEPSLCPVGSPVFSSTPGDAAAAAAGDAQSEHEQAEQQQEQELEQVLAWAAERISAVAKQVAEAQQPKAEAINMSEASDDAMVPAWLDDMSGCETGHAASSKSPHAITKAAVGAGECHAAHVASVACSFAAASIDEGAAEPPPTDGWIHTISTTPAGTGSPATHAEAYKSLTAADHVDTANSTSFAGEAPVRLAICASPPARAGDDEVCSSVAALSVLSSLSSCAAAIADEIPEAPLAGDSHWYLLAASAAGAAQIAADSTAADAANASTGPFSPTALDAVQLLQQQDEHQEPQQASEGPDEGLDPAAGDAEQEVDGPIPCELDKAQQDQPSQWHDKHPSGHMNCHHQQQQQALQTEGSVTPDAESPQQHSQLHQQAEDLQKGLLKHQYASTEHEQLPANLQQHLPWEGAAAVPELASQSMACQVEDGDVAAGSMQLPLSHQLEQQQPEEGPGQDMPEACSAGTLELCQQQMTSLQEGWEGPEGQLQKQQQQLEQPISAYPTTTDGYLQQRSGTVVKEEHSWEVDLQQQEPHRDEQLPGGTFAAAEARDTFIREYEGAADAVGGSSDAVQLHGQNPLHSQSHVQQLQHRQPLTQAVRVQRLMQLKQRRSQQSNAVGVQPQVQQVDTLARSPAATTAEQLPLVPSLPQQQQHAAVPDDSYAAWHAAVGAVTSNSTSRSAAAACMAAPAASPLPNDGRSSGWAPASSAVRRDSQRASVAAVRNVGGSNEGECAATAAAAVLPNRNPDAKWVKGVLQDSSSLSSCIQMIARGESSRGSAAAAPLLGGHPTDTSATDTCSTKSSLLALLQTAEDALVAAKEVSQPGYGTDTNCSTISKRGMQAQLQLMEHQQQQQGLLQEAARPTSPVRPLGLWQNKIKHLLDAADAATASIREEKVSTAAAQAWPAAAVAAATTAKVKRKSPLQGTGAAAKAPKATVTAVPGVADTGVKVLTTGRPTQSRPATPPNARAVKEERANKAGRAAGTTGKAAAGAVEPAAGAVSAATVAARPQPQVVQRQQPLPQPRGTAQQHTGSRQQQSRASQRQIAQPPAQDLASASPAIAAVATTAAAAPQALDSAACAQLQQSTTGSIRLRSIPGPAVVAAAAVQLSTQLEQLAPWQKQRAASNGPAQQLDGKPVRPRDRLKLLSQQQQQQQQQQQHPKESMRGLVAELAHGEDGACADAPFTAPVAARRVNHNLNQPCVKGGADVSAKPATTTQEQQQQQVRPAKLKQQQLLHGAAVQQQKRAVAATAVPSAARPLLVTPASTALAPLKSLELMQAAVQQGYIFDVPRAQGYLFNRARARAAAKLVATGTDATDCCSIALEVTSTTAGKATAGPETGGKAATATAPGSGSKQQQQQQASSSSRRDSSRLRAARLGARSSDSPAATAKQQLAISQGRRQPMVVNPEPDGFNRHAVAGEGSGHTTWAVIAAGPAGHPHDAGTDAHKQQQKQQAHAGHFDIGAGRKSHGLSLRHARKNVSASGAAAAQWLQSPTGCGSAPPAAALMQGSGRLVGNQKQQAVCSTSLAQSGDGSRNRTPAGMVAAAAALRAAAAGFGSKGWQQQDIASWLCKLRLDLLPEEPSQPLLSNPIRNGLLLAGIAAAITREPLPGVHQPVRDLVAARSNLLKAAAHMGMIGSGLAEAAAAAAAARDRSEALTGSPGRPREAAVLFGGSPHGKASSGSCSPGRCRSRSKSRSRSARSYSPDLDSQHYLRLAGLAGRDQQRGAKCLQASHGWQLQQQKQQQQQKRGCRDLPVAYAACRGHSRSRSVSPGHRAASGSPHRNSSSCSRHGASILCTDCECFASATAAAGSWTLTGEEVKVHSVGAAAAGSLSSTFGAASSCCCDCWSCCMLGGSMLEHAVMQLLELILAGDVSCMWGLLYALQQAFPMAGAARAGAKAAAAGTSASGRPSVKLHGHEQHNNQAGGHFPRQGSPGRFAVGGTTGCNSCWDGTAGVILVQPLRGPSWCSFQLPYSPQELDVLEGELLLWLESLDLISAAGTADFGSISPHLASGVMLAEVAAAVSALPVLGVAERPVNALARAANIELAVDAVRCLPGITFGHLLLSHETAVLAGERPALTALLECLWVWHMGQEGMISPQGAWLRWMTHGVSSSCSSRRGHGSSNNQGWHFSSTQSTEAGMCRQTASAGSAAAGAATTAAAGVSRRKVSAHTAAAAAGVGATAVSKGVGGGGRVVGAAHGGRGHPSGGVVRDKPHEHTWRS